MVLPEHRYNFSAKKYKRSSPGKKIIIILAVLAAAAGVILIFILPKNKGDVNTHKLSEIEAMYEYWNVKKYDNVISTGESVLAETPLNSQAMALAGFSFFYKALGEYSMENKLALIDNSITYLRKLKVIGNNPYPGETEYILGKAYFHKGKYYVDQSIDHMQAALEGGYTADDIFEYLGLAYSEAGLYEEALDYFLQAADVKDSPLLYLTIAQTYYKLNDRKKAEEFLQRTINSTKDLALEERCRYLLAQIYIDSNNSMKAVEQYNKILEKNPQAADAHFQLGVIYDSMNDTVKARAEWRKTLQIDPSHYGARYHYYD